MNNYFEQAIHANQRQQQLRQEAEKLRLSEQSPQRTTIKRQFRRVLTTTGTVLIIAGQRIQT